MRIAQVQQRVLQLQGQSFIQEAWREWMNQAPRLKEMKFRKRQLLRRIPKHRILQSLLRSSRVKKLVTEEHPDLAVLPATRTVHVLYHLFRLPNEEFVAGLFHELLNRSPESHELQGFNSLLEMENDRWKVFKMVAFSPEAQIVWKKNTRQWTTANVVNRTFSLQGRAFVSALTKELLGRAPLRAEIGRLSKVANSPGGKEKVLATLLYSNAFRRAVVMSRIPRGLHVRGRALGPLRRLVRRNGVAFVIGLYEELLGRTPNQEAIRLHLTKLKRTRKLDLIRGILLSPEAQLNRRAAEQSLFVVPYTRADEPAQTATAADVELIEFHPKNQYEDGFPEHTSDQPAVRLKKRVTIIVLTWNGLEHTKRCLESIRTSVRDPLVDVIVVDNGSNDGTVEYLQSLHDVKVILNGENVGFTKGNNQAILQSDSNSDVILLNNDVIAEQADWINLLQETAYQDEHRGVVGCRLIGEDSQLQHAGTYIYPETCWGQLEGGIQTDLNQFSATRNVQGIVFACAYIKREVLDGVGLLDTDYFAYFEDTDYCLKAIKAGYQVVVDGRITLRHVEHVSTNENHVNFSDLFGQSQQTFREKWESYLQSQYDSSVNWHSLIHIRSGYANSSLALMHALDGQGTKVNYRYVYGPGTPVPSIEPDATSDYRANIFRSRGVDPGAPEVVYGQGDVFHKNTGRYKIGYTMLEVDGLPTEWVQQANLMDEIWVPSHFNVETFQHSGVQRPIYVMPLGVDPNYFNPDIQGHRFTEKFTFLSNFEWGIRKSPLELIQTFCNEFSNEDDVILILKISNLNPSINVLEEIRNLNLGSNIRKIKLIFNQDIPYWMLGSLYRSVDCFVFPTRGEGWGLPILEAMACGIPSIATDWSGQREFLNSETAYPIQVKRLVPAQHSSPYYEGFNWADPDWEHLAHLMRHVYENREHAKQRAAQVSQRVLEQWSWNEAAKRIKERLFTIRQNYL